MWCYGIWVSRVMWVVAEYFADVNWIAWPENIAPATYYMVVMWDNLDKALELAKKFESEWFDVIIDDREKVWFGQKAWDADLLWIPTRIVISDKTLEAWWYEIKKRWEEETKIVKL
jgi:prolyl-tRNA synthetase